jgi:GNAT superfamily N-acetyltransferase
MSTYIKSHLAISRDKYDLLSKAAYYDHEQVHIKRIKPDMTQYSLLLHRVGKNYGWDRRPKYLLEKEALEKRILDEGSHFYLAYEGQNLIGYCLASPCEERTGKALDKVIEIENFGLFPEYTGKALGQSFLAQTFDDLFQTYNNVYLTTRSTNHKGVIPFYTKMGMRVIYRESMLDDLVEIPAESFSRTA